MTDAETIAAYDARARDYARLIGTEGEVRSLRDFIDALPKEARVLDLGCGPGHASAEMARKGLLPDPVDASTAMVDMAREKGLAARLARFEDIQGEGDYHGIWANFSLLHARRDQFPELITALHRALVPGGLLHIGMKLGEGEQRDALGRFYTYYTIPELTGILGAAGFAITSITTGVGKGLAGTLDPWCLIGAQR